ncbi:MAG: hypothetical protein HC862_11350 [Scytonema sp. RU_4_4]|nr:hypothetical protein [Scytonema sp. RU_4_4]
MKSPHPMAQSNTRHGKCVIVRRAALALTARTVQKKADMVYGIKGVRCEQDKLTHKFNF